MVRHGGCLLRQSGGWNEMRHKTELKTFRCGHPVPEYGHSRRSGTPNMGGESLHAPCDWHHARSHLNILKYRVFGGDDQVAGKRELETATHSDALYRCQRRDAQCFDGPIGLVHFRHECPEPVDVFSWPLPHFTAETEVLTFRSDHQDADAALARPVHCIKKVGRVGRVDPVEGRIGQEDAADCAVLFEPDCLQVCLLSLQLRLFLRWKAVLQGPTDSLDHFRMIGRSRWDGCSASR